MSGVWVNVHWVANGKKSDWKKWLKKLDDFCLVVNNSCVNIKHLWCVPLSDRTTGLRNIYSVHCHLSFDRETDGKIGYTNCDLEKLPDYFTKNKKNSSTQKVTEQKKILQKIAYLGVQGVIVERTHFLWGQPGLGLIESQRQLGNTGERWTFH